MARQKPPDPPGDDVPSWVMTFSDVITLLMTFFILLLTFATNQPETFDRVQVAMFGGGGSTGIAGVKDGMEKDSLLMRERAQTGRMTQKGSEMPPIYSDPALETLADGIAGLEEKELRVLSTTHRLELALTAMVDQQGKLTSQGQQQLRMLAIQMKKRPLQLEFVVHDETSLDRALKLAEQLTQLEGIPDARVGVGIASHQVGKERLLLILDKPGAKRGS